MNLYDQQRQEQQERMNEFLNRSAFFAFSEEQFSKGLEKLGTDTGSIVSIGGGGYVLKEKVSEFKDILNRAKREREEALADPETGPQFAYCMFYSELANHEYGYTGRADDALDALGLSWEDLDNSEMLREAFEKAREAIIAKN